MTSKLFDFFQDGNVDSDLNDAESEIDSMEVNENENELVNSDSSDGIESDPQDEDNLPLSHCK